MASELARSWVSSLAEQLTTDGRRLEGGWPGTISDARRLLTRRLAALATKLAPPEFDRLVKAIYDDAKTQWLAIADRCSPDSLVFDD